MRNIILLGAGRMGQAIARRLHGCGDYRLLAADCDAAALWPLQALGVATRHADCSDTAELRALLADGAAVINALPGHLAIPVAEAARAAGVHYFDLGEDAQAARRIRQLAANADSAFMPQCGLAPGFVGIAAHHLAQDVDDIREIKIRVGVLPAFPADEIPSKLSWSVDGLVDAYCRPCETIRDGAPRLAQPLEGLEHFSLDGIGYEAFNTAGGLGLLCDTLAGRAAHLDFKSVRYPGHRDRLRFLLEELRLKERPKLLKDLLRHATPTPMRDVALVLVTVSGSRDGHALQRTLRRKMYAAQQDGVFDSALQVTTAAGVCAALDLFFAGRLPQRGFIRQEQVALPALLGNRFGRVFAAADEEAARGCAVGIDKVEGRQALACLA